MITLRLQVFLLVIWVLLLALLIRKMAIKRINIRYLLPWVVLDLIMIVLTLVPSLIEWLSKALGIAVPSNMLFLLGIILLAVIIFYQSNTISQLSARVRELTQRLAIYEHESEKRTKEQE